MLPALPANRCHLPPCLTTHGSSSEAGSSLVGLAKRSIGGDIVQAAAGRSWAPANGASRATMTAARERLFMSLCMFTLLSSDSLATFPVARSPMRMRDGDDVYLAAIWISKVKNKRKARDLGPSVRVVVSREPQGGLGARFGQRQDLVDERDGRALGALQVPVNALPELLFGEPMKASFHERD